jgi:hypothetical protein
MIQSSGSSITSGEAGNEIFTGLFQIAVLFQLGFNENKGPG